MPAPPAEVPPSLARAVGQVSAGRPLWTRRRLGAALALAAAVAGVFFAAGFWARGGDSFEAGAAVALQATASAPGAAGVIRLGPRDDASGNWEMEIELSGLPTLPKGGYYVLWLAKDGEWAGTCGTFNVSGERTTVRLTAAYELREYDEWVVTAWLPDRDNDDAPWLLKASSRV